MGRRNRNRRQRRRPNSWGDSLSKSQQNCLNKRRYKTKVDALIVMARIQHKDQVHRESLPKRVYACPHCKGWHLTSKG